jgi:putative heme transporter
VERRGDSTVARLRPVALALVAALVCVEAAVFARHAGPVVHRLADLDPEWLALAVVASTGSMTAFAALQRAMLNAAGARLTLRQALLMAYAGNAVALSLPGGSLAGTAYTYRRLRRWRTPVAAIAWGLTAAGVLSSIALTLIAAVGATLAERNASSGLVQGGAELLVALLVVLSGRWLYAHPAVVSRLLATASMHVARVLGRPTQRVPERVRQAVNAFLAVRAPVRAWGTGAVAALVNWLLDLACLAAAAEGVVTGHLGLGTLLLAYAVGMAAGSLPLLPAGAGTVDGALVGVFTARGVPTTQALAAVLFYRGITVVLLAVVGWVAAFVLHVEDTAVAAPSERDLHTEPARRDGQHEAAVDGGDGASVEEELPG